MYVTCRHRYDPWSWRNLSGVIPVSRGTSKVSKESQFRFSTFYKTMDNYLSALNCDTGEIVSLSAKPVEGRRDWDPPHLDLLCPL